MLPDKDGPGVGGGQSSSEGEDPSVGLFREYLRLRTVHPDPDYGETASSQRWAVLSGYTVLCEFILNVKSVSMIDKPGCDDFSPKCSSYHFWELRFLWSEKGISMLVLEQMPGLKRALKRRRNTGLFVLTLFHPSDAALGFLGRMAEELGLPMKKFEVRLSEADSNVSIISTWTWYPLSPHFFWPPPLGLSRPSGVGNHMGRVEPCPEIHPAELPHRCCTCLSGVSFFLSQLKLFSWYHL